MNPKLKQEWVKKVLLEYHTNNLYKFDVESCMNNVNKLQKNFNIYSNKFSSLSSLHLCIGYSSSSITSNSYFEESENFFSAIDNSPLVNNKFSSYLHAPIWANMSKFDILES